MATYIFCQRMHSAQTKIVPSTMATSFVQAAPGSARTRLGQTSETLDMSSNHHNDLLVTNLQNSQILVLVSA